MELGRPHQRVVELARWWTSASAKARFALWDQATKENRPPLAQLRLAVILAEVEAGEISEG